MNNALGQLVTLPLGFLIELCYYIFKDYGIAIVFFTLITKSILLPLSLWVHKNGIKVVKLQPEFNHLKATYFGDPDQIAEKTAELYKREKYNPFASIIPLFIQLALLIGLVGVINTPFNNILPLSQTDINQLVDATVMATGADPESSSIQLTAIEAVQSGKYHEAFSGIPENVLNSVQNVNLSFWGLDLAATPAQAGGVLLLVPLLAGLAALLLSLIQNKLNPLQAEQSTAGKFGTTAFSVGLSLFLGAFVPAGVGFYWIWSNLFTIVQQYLLNWMIDPKKAIDYDALEKSKRELEGLQSIGGKKKWLTHDPNAKREKADYKRFFSIANKHLVFYSEKSGFYKYFENVIEYLLDHSNAIIHYITSDPEDAIFNKAKTQPKIKPYYIGEKKLITLMMKMDADIVVMTMPDLENFHIKRSYTRKDIEYIFMFHGPLSMHMAMKKGCVDHFDTIFSVGSHTTEEVRKAEEIYKLPAKTIVNCGYGLLETLRNNYLCYLPSNSTEHRKKILIAPSWQPDNIMEQGIQPLLNELGKDKYIIIVRPHPQYLRKFSNKILELQKLYQDNINIEFQVDFSIVSSIFEADVLISDWSGIAYEFAFATSKPVIFINTPMKVMNLDYAEIGIEPLEITLRDQIGVSVDLDKLDKIDIQVEYLLKNAEEYSETIDHLREKLFYNFGNSGAVGAKYILNSLKSKQLLRGVRE